MSVFRKGRRRAHAKAQTASLSRLRAQSRTSNLVLAMETRRARTISRIEAGTDLLKAILGTVTVSAGIGAWMWLTTDAIQALVGL